MIWVIMAWLAIAYSESQSIGIKGDSMKNAHVFIALLISVCSPVTAEELELLTTNCDGCHGPLGASITSDIPVIGGQSAASIEKALGQFRNWGRPCKRSAYRHGDTSRPASNMCEISEAMSIEDIKALANHYESQAFVPAIQEFDEAGAMEGASLHALYCITCHPKGGSEAGYAARLAGQWKPYLRTTVTQIISGEWPVPKIMERKMSSFSEQEVEALLDFFASQQD
jgi:sulfide dehydrogenase cytochrome subunit